jgi:PAP2 superfamily protein
MPGRVRNGTEVHDKSLEDLRQATLWFAAASVLIAVSMIAVSDVRLDSRGAAILAGLPALLLVISRHFRVHGSSPRVAGAFGAIGLIWVAALACGFISLMGLRLHMPLVDAELLSLDRMIGVDTLALLERISTQPAWFHDVMRIAYEQTVLVLFVSLILRAAVDDCIEVWRAALCFVGSLLSVCLISLVTPAKGIRVWAPEQMMGRLPIGAGRYFWQSFDQFYSGREPLLGVHSINGVISFPSFHIIMGLITLTIWRKQPLVLAIAAVWFALMLTATVPFGGHYVVDLIGGCAVWLLWHLTSNALGRASRAPAVPIGERAEILVHSA